MDIDKWLDKVLKDIKSADPKTLIEKLEKYGLVGKEKFIENNVTEQKKISNIISVDIFYGYCINKTHINI